MATRYFALTEDVKNSIYTQNGEYKFKLGCKVILEDGTQTFMAASTAPTLCITLDQGLIVTDDDDHCQGLLEGMKLPSFPPSAASGMAVFEEVDSSYPELVDLGTLRSGA